MNSHLGEFSLGEFSFRWILIRWIDRFPIRWSQTWYQSTLPLNDCLIVCLTKQRLVTSLHTLISGCLLVTNGSGLRYTHSTLRWSYCWSSQLGAVGRMSEDIRITYTTVIIAHSGHRFQDFETKTTALQTHYSVGTAHSTSALTSHSFS